MHAGHAHHDHAHHGHDHAHDHGHGHHHHPISADADARMLALALALNLGFMVVEVVVGLLAHSLALISDAGHMLTDAAAIGLALFAARVARRPSEGAMTFGYRRAEVLSAQFNGMTLVLLGAYVVVEAVMRLSDPPSVDASLMLLVALAGAAVNLAAALALARADRRNMNVEGAFQHTLWDLMSSLGAAVAAVVILVWGFDRADAVASLVIAVPMLRSGIGLLRVSGRVLMEAAPRGTDPDEIGAALAAEAGVVEVHDLHVWEVSSGFAALSAHVVVAEHDDCHNIRWDLERVLRERFGITHTTLQIDHVQPPELLRIEPPPEHGAPPSG
jgi:cobalt-zinc-cadmium efflux system protein